MEWAGLEDDVPIEHGMVNKSIENAQTKVEAHNFDIRKHVVDYDDVMSVQRAKIYDERRKILEGADLKANVEEMVAGEIEALVNQYCNGRDSEEWDTESFWAEVCAMFPEPPADLDPDKLRLMSRDEIEQTLQDYADDAVSVVKWLRKQKSVDPKRVAVIGRAEGAAAALLAAARAGGDVAAVGLLSGPGMSGAEYVLAQQAQEDLLLARSDAHR